MSFQIYNDVVQSKNERKETISSLTVDQTSDNEEDEKFDFN